MERNHTDHGHNQKIAALYNEAPPQFQKITFKKRNNIPIDKQQLYAQNILLKAKIQQMTDTNVKMKTQLTITQRQKLNLCNIAQEQIFHPKVISRAQSGNHKKSLINIKGQKHLNNIPNPPVSSISRDVKQITVLKKVMRQQKQQIDRLNNQISRIKKTVKYTRISEQMIQNKELLQQTLRLNKKIAQTQTNQAQNYNHYSDKIQFFKRKQSQQREKQKKWSADLKDLIKLNAQLKQQIRQNDYKKIQIERRLTQQIKLLIQQNGDLKRKLAQKEVSHFKQAQKEDYLKVKREYRLAQNKIVELQKQIRFLNEKLILTTKQQFVRSLQKRQPSNTNLKNKPKTAVTRKIIQYKNSQKPETEPQLKKSSPRQQQKLIINKQQQEKIPETQKKQSVVANQKDQVKEKQDSEDTQKLIQNLQEPPNLRIQSIHELNIKPRGSPENSQHQFVQPVKKDDSEGYQQIDLVQFDEQVGKNSPKKPQKANKKQAEMSDEQVLYKKQEKQQKKEIELVDRQELKLIKQTLVYKFKAQGYTYQDFCTDIKKSQIKTFKVSQIIEILRDQPFLMGQDSIQKTAIYLFQTKSFSGQQKITSQNFTKKMKKFVGKAENFDEQRENNNIVTLKQIIDADQSGQKNFIKNCKKADKEAKGFITKNQFTKIMKQMKVSEQILQTAIAQQVYVSDHINRLNYQMFIKRFTQDVEQQMSSF